MSCRYKEVGSLWLAHEVSLEQLTACFIYKQGVGLRNLGFQRRQGSAWSFYLYVVFSLSHVNFSHPSENRKRNTSLITFNHSDLIYIAILIFSLYFTSWQLFIVPSYFIIINISIICREGFTHNMYNCWVVHVLSGNVFLNAYFQFF